MTIQRAVGIVTNMIPTETKDEYVQAWQKVVDEGIVSTLPAQYLSIAQQLSKDKIITSQATTNKRSES